MMDKTTRNLKAVINESLNYIDDCRNVMDAPAFAKKLWDLGVTDGIENDADSYKSEDADSIEGDLNEILSEMPTGDFNGSYSFRGSEQEAIGQLDI